MLAFNGEVRRDFLVADTGEDSAVIRGLYAAGSSWWRDPNAQLLEGVAWDAVTLHETYTTVSRRPAANTAVTVDEQGKVHVAGVKAIEEPRRFDLRNGARR